MSETPIFDLLIREREGRMPGQLTEQDLKELADYQAALGLPEPVLIEVEPMEAPQSPVQPLSRVEAPTPPAPVAEEPQEAAESPQETTQTVEVKVLQEKLVVTSTAEDEGSPGEKTQSMPVPQLDQETQEMTLPVLRKKVA